MQKLKNFYTQLNRSSRRNVKIASSVVVIVILGGIIQLVSNAATVTTSLWENTDLPAGVAIDTRAIEVGTKFQAAVPGKVTGVRFYKGPKNTGVHTGSLWDSTGKRLAQLTFTNETTDGWQTALLATPVTISANTVYTVSYHTNTGGYAIDNNYFNQARVKGDLSAPQSTIANPNGIYTLSSTSVYPRTANQATNFWVDVIFESVQAEQPGGPSAPTDLQASVDGNTVTLRWAASTGSSIQEYALYRDGSRIKTVSGTSTSTTDSNLQAGQTYRYQVQATDASGKNSALSSELPVTVSPAPAPGPTKPAVPTGLSATVQNGSQVTLNWQAGSGGTTATKYNVFRGNTKLVTVTGTTYADSSVIANTTYQYQVQAVDANNNISDLSAPISAVIPAAGAVPSAPTQLRAVTGGKDIALTWRSNPTASLKGYNVYRDGAKIGSTTPGTNPGGHKYGTLYVDQNVVRGKQYRYKVQAVTSDDKLSAFSGEVVATHPLEANTSPLPTITLDYSRMPVLESFMKNLAKPELETWYPKMVDQLARGSYAPRQSFKITADPNYVGNAQALNEGTIVLGAAFDKTTAALIHEATHIVQTDPASTATLTASAWQMESLADWVKYSFYFDNDPALTGFQPIKPATELYTNGYSQGERFLEWVRTTQNAPNLIRTHLKNASAE